VAQKDLSGIARHPPGADAWEDDALNDDDNAPDVIDVHWALLELFAI
jgi:hypothetical protein